MVVDKTEGVQAAKSDPMVREAPLGKAIGFDANREVLIEASAAVLNMGGFSTYSCRAAIIREENSVRR